MPNDETATLKRHDPSACRARRALCGLLACALTVLTCPAPAALAAASGTLRPYATSDDPDSLGRLENAIGAAVLPADIAVRLRRPFRLIISDVNNSLIPSDPRGLEGRPILEPETRQLISQLNTRGARLAVISGSQLVSLQRRLTDRLDPGDRTGLLLFINGGGAGYEFDTAGDLIEEPILFLPISLDATVVERTRQVMEDVVISMVSASPDGSREGLPIRTKETDGVAIQLSVTGLDQPEHQALRDRIAEEIRARLLDDPRFSGIHVFASSVSIEVMRGTKGDAVRRVIRHVLTTSGIQPEDVLIIGDSATDAPMFEAVDRATRLYVGERPYPGMPEDVIHLPVRGPPGTRAALRLVLEAYDTDAELGRSAQSGAGGRKEFGIEVRTDPILTQLGMTIEASAAALRTQGREVVYLVGSELVQADPRTLVALREQLDAAGTDSVKLVYVQTDPDLTEPELAAVLGRAPPTVFDGVIDGLAILSETDATPARRQRFADTLQQATNLRTVPTQENMVILSANASDETVLKDRPTREETLFNELVDGLHVLVEQPLGDPQDVQPDIALAIATTLLAVSQTPDLPPTLEELTPAIRTTQDVLKQPGLSLHILPVTDSELAETRVRASRLIARHV